MACIDPNSLIVIKVVLILCILMVGTALVNGLVTNKKLNDIRKIYNNHKENKS
jgi:hypothetical protein